MLAFSILESEIGSDIHLKSQGPATLSLHQGSGGPKTRLRFFSRNGLKDDKICP